MTKTSSRSNKISFYKPKFLPLQAKKGSSKKEDNAWSLLQKEVVDSAAGDPTLDEAVRAKLKSELASPLRGLRKYLYVAIGASAGISLFISLPQLLFAIQDNSEKIQTAATNVGINLAGVIAVVFFAIRENQSEKEQLDLFTEKETVMTNRLSVDQLTGAEQEIALLPVEIQVSEIDGNKTRVVSFSDLQIKGRQNVVIFAGELATVSDALIAAKIEGNALFNDKETFVVPVVTSSINAAALSDGENVPQIEDKPSKGFGAVKEKESLMTAPYIAKPAQLNVWLAYLKKEVELAASQGTKDITKQGLVLAVNKKGKVVRRGVGRPPWKQLVEELEQSSKGRE